MVTTWNSYLIFFFVLKDLINTCNSNIIAAKEHKDKYCTRNFSCLIIKIALKTICFQAWKTLVKWDENVSYIYKKKSLVMLMA
jgi:hypothetical protein